MHKKSDYYLTIPVCKQWH